MSHTESREAYREFYRGLAAHGNQHLNADFGRIQFALRHIRWGDAVLEMGCQDGGITQHIARKAATVYAVEINREAIDRAPALPNVRYECCFAEDLDHGEVFNAVLAMELLEHVMDPFELLCVAHNATKPGGKLILTVPEAGKYVDNIGEHVREYDDAALFMELSRVYGPANVDVFPERNGTSLFGLAVK